MKLSVIIPALNEARYIDRLVRYLHQHSDARLAEILVVDGGSTDDTAQLARRAGAQVLETGTACRATQLNFGTTRARGNVYYFVHADVLPPANYLDAIEAALQRGYLIGACRQKFESRRLLLRVNSWFTRFNTLFLRGGDQTLFVTREVFRNLGGFNEQFVIMEDYDFMRSARALYPFTVLPCNTHTSARKYEKNSWLRVQLANLRAVRQFKRGVDPQLIRDTYKRSLNW